MVVNRLKSNCPEVTPLSVCVCVCVCERARECVCVCVFYTFYNPTPKDLSLSATSTCTDTTERLGERQNLRRGLQLEPVRDLSHLRVTKPPLDTGQ